MSVWGNLVSLHKKIPSIPLKKDVIVFGRSDKCDIVFDNKIISTNHFILTRINNEVFITDFSSNGTFLNGTKLKKETKTKLKTSDLISLIITGISDPSFEQVGYVYRFEYISSSISSPIKTPEKKPIIKLERTPEKPEVHKSFGDELTFLTLQASQGSIDLLSKLDSLDNNFEDLPNDEEGTPEKYYNLIKVNPSLSVLSDLNEKLQSCDEEFISDFLTLGGLELLSETLSVKTRNKNENEHIDVNIQLVECIETILNEQIGLNEAMEVKNFFETIALSLDNDSYQVQDTILKILATGCCFGVEGHKKVIRAFEKYKEKHRERKRFSNLVLKLNTDNVKVKANTMLLINAIVNIPVKIEDRLELRKEFLALGVKEMANSLKIIGNEELDQQLDLFLEEMEDDNEDVIIDNVDISDPVQLASLIRNQVNIDPKIKTSFVCIMHSLSLLPKDNESGQKAWELIENFLQRVLNLGNTTQLEFKEIKDLLENKIEVKEVKKKVGKLEEERKNLQIKLDNITNESSKRQTDLLESHQRELLDLASKHTQKLKTLELDHKQELLMVENKHTSRIQELEKKVDNANSTISKLEKEISELQSRSPNKIVPSKVTTKNIFQMLAYKSLTTQIVPQSNLEFPKLEKAKGEMPGTRVFGISLDSLQAREASQVPIFFSSAISWLESNAMDVEGIFRISGELSKLSELKESIDNGLYFFTENYDPHLISNIIKNFLRELPDPLVEKKYTEALLKINEFTETEAKIEALQMIFILISESRLSLLRFLLQFLSKVSANQSVNKMGPSNLSIVFAPNLFEPLDPLKDLQKLNTLFELIIINQHAIFEGYPKSILQSYNQVVSSPENLNKAKFEFLEKADPTSANLMKMDQSSDRPSLPSPIIEVTDSSPPPMPPMPPPPPGGDSFAPPPPPPGGDMGGMPPPPPFGGGLTNVGSSASLDKELNETRPKPKAKMRQLYWKKVPNNHISKSIWKELKWDKVPIPASEIEKLFGTAVQPQFSETESTPQQVEKKAPTSTKITIFDVKRSNNIGIMLSQFRGLEASQLRDSIITLNDDILTVENMRQLSKNMPTEEEEMALNNYDGELEHLGKVEVFFKTLLEIPQLKGRVESYIYKSTFEEQLQEAKNDVDTISKAIDQLQNSMELKKILALILAIGNFMNYSAFKPATHGFDIEFLPRLADTKTSDKRSTFLHFLAKLMNAHFPEEIKNLFTGLSHVEPSSKLPLSIVSQKVNLLVLGFSQVTEQIKHAKKSTLRNDQFINVMTKFESSADREIKDLTRNLKSIEEESTKLLSFYCSKEAKSVEEFFGLFSSFLVNFEKAISDNEREGQRSEKLKQLKEKRANRQNEKKELNKTITLQTQTTEISTQSTDTEKSKHDKFEEKRKLAQQRKKGKAMDNIHLTIRSGAAFPTRQEGSSSGNTVRRTVAKRNNSSGGNGTTVMNLFN